MLQRIDGVQQHASTVSQAINSHIYGDSGCEKKQYVVRRLTAEWAVRQHHVCKAGEPHQTGDGQGSVNDILSETRHGETPVDETDDRKESASGCGLWSISFISPSMPAGIDFGTLIDGNSYSYAARWPGCRSGKRMLNLLPCPDPSLDGSIVPWWSSMILCVMLSPNPVPCPVSLVE